MSAREAFAQAYRALRSLQHDWHTPGCPAYDRDLAPCDCGWGDEWAAMNATPAGRAAIDASLNRWTGDRLENWMTLVRIETAWKRSGVPF